MMTRSQGKAVNGARKPAQEDSLQQGNPILYLSKVRARVGLLRTHENNEVFSVFIDFKEEKIC
jgi:hypothetical protein